MSWLPWARGPELSAAAKSYRAGTPRKVPRKAPLSSLRFLVLDAETTGFDPVVDRLLSIAMIPVTEGQISVSELRSWIVFQPTVTLNQATAVHGILPSETAGGLAEPAVMAELLPLLEGTILVGHHIAFDVAMLNSAMKKHHAVQIRNPVLDTARLAMQVLEAFKVTGYPGQRPPSLEEICEHCGIQPMDRHTAEGDAFTTAELFLVLCARLQRKRGRLLTAADLPLTGP